MDFISKKKRNYKNFFERVAKIVQEKGKFGKLRIKKTEDYPKIFSYIKKMRNEWDDLLIDIKRLDDLLSTINSNVFKNYEEHTDNINAALQKITEFSEIIDSLSSPDFNDFALWFSISDTSSKQLALGSINYAPLRVGNYFHEYLYSKDISVLFTSATLSLRESFKYYKSKMGLDLVEEDKLNELIVESPFDYKKQSAALVPTMLPSPQTNEYISKSVKLVKKIILESKKGIMILFTSYRDLNYYYENLKDTLYAEDILLLAQGKGISRSMMLYEFKKNKKAVLLGTNSFWEGVDIPGEALSILILTKLPFLVPSDPIVEAFIELLEYEGKNSFMHYMLPNALLKYRQGFGRLIRNKTDKGLVIVLDNRVIKKFYGKYFREILPTKTKIIFSDEEMTEFLINWSF
jgi:ATP-dependent DNA helicase DinG